MYVDRKSRIKTILSSNSQLLTKNQNTEERNQILSSYLDSDILGFSQFDSSPSDLMNDSELLSSNKDDDYKLQKLKSSYDPKKKNLMLLFLQNDEKSSGRDGYWGLSDDPEDESCIINSSLKDTPKFSPENSKESVARFINAMASIKTGRDYISKCLLKNI